VVSCKPVCFEYGKYKSISFRQNMRPVQFKHCIGGKTLGRVDGIRDLDMFLDTKGTFMCHIEAVIELENRSFHVFS
jgi:hypothetical protein